MTYVLLSGASFAFALVAALLFARAFRRTRDRLFMYFSIAFVVLAVNQLLLASVAHDEGSEPLAYLPRIIAFGIILFAIVDRNRR